MICAHCGKASKFHRARTFQCPIGSRGRIGYTQYGNTVFEPKKASPRPHKYRAKPVTIDGIKFASHQEGKRYGELKLLERGGKIHGLECHPVYELAPAVKFEGAKRKKPALRYVADFRYFGGEPRARIVEDVKSPSTAKLAAFVLKRHLMLSIHRIDVRIIS